MPRGEAPLSNTVPYHSRGNESTGDQTRASHSTTHLTNHVPHQSSHWSGPLHRPPHLVHAASDDRGENQRIPEDDGRGGSGARSRAPEKDQLTQYEEEPEGGRVAAFGTCCVCKQNPADTAFSCGHICVCQNCVRLLTICPLCRKQQVGKPLKCYLNQALAPANPYTVGVSIKLPPGDAALPGA